MQTGKILAVVGLFAVTAGLVCGVGAVTAQPTSPERAAAKAVPPGVRPEPQPGLATPAAALKAPADDLEREHQERSSRFKQLQDLATSLRQEIEGNEKRIQLMIEINDFKVINVDIAKKTLLEVGSEISRTEIELEDQKAELEILSRHMNSKQLTGPEIESSRVYAENRQEVQDAARALATSREALVAVQATIPNPKDPAVARRQADVDRRAVELEQARSAARKDTDMLVLEERRKRLNVNRELLQLKIEHTMNRIKSRESIRNNYRKQLNVNTTYDRLITNFTRDLEVLRESLGQVERELMRLRIERQLGSPLVVPPGEETKPAAILAELKQLRREVAELRKDVRQQKSP